MSEPGVYTGHFDTKSDDQLDKERNFSAFHHEHWVCYSIIIFGSRCAKASLAKGGPAPMMQPEMWRCGICYTRLEALYAVCIGTSKTYSVQTMNEVFECVMASWKHIWHE